MSGKTNRTKGHSLEREIASLFREIGFEYAKTTRAESKTLDNAGVDIANVPFLIQCKSGYDTRYPRFPEISIGIRENISKAYPKESPFQNAPVILIHKPTRSQTYWAISQDFGLDLLKKSMKNIELFQKCLEVLEKAQREILDLEENLQFSNEENDVYGYEEETEDRNEFKIYNETYDEIEELKNSLENVLK